MNFLANPIFSIQYNRHISMSSKEKKKRERENCLNDRNIEIIQRKLLKTEGY